MTDTNFKRIQPMEPQRDGGGWWTHPDFFQPANGNEYPLPGEFKAWLEAHGVECRAWMMGDEVEDDSDVTHAYDKWCVCSAWEPESQGAGWFLVSIHDTEDGPCAVWLRYKDGDA